MDTVFWSYNLGSFTITLSAWKIIGYVACFLFTLRWVVQAVASKQAGKPTVPRLFWYMSIVGSFLLLLYYIFGKNDGPGIISNLFPGILACYNLYLDFTHHDKKDLKHDPTEIPSEAA